MPLPGRPGVTTVLWDLDGTLVGLRQRTFGVLMPLVAAAAFRDVLPPHRFLPMLRATLDQVRRNDGELTNHELLVRLLAERAAVSVPEADRRFRALAATGLPRLRRCFRPVPAARVLVDLLAERGVTQVVATNPLWPRSTAENRLRWGGIDPVVFTHICSGETMRRAKPRVEYYAELLELLGVTGEQCVMVGNDPVKDPPATALGIPVYLLHGGTDNELVTGGDWHGLADWLGLPEDSCFSS
ncbi:MULTISPECIES: HAD family hydrolase [unclassified Nocardia]|uniref:HAD family hydrolase n=1 Tax=unclassified Nocardia TaxID=2637762 RepID=UPI00278BC2AD|nr:MULTISPECIES: HAD family hydrolase [unclassified Nocardia]